MRNDDNKNGNQPNNQGQYGYQPNNQGQYGYQPNNQGQYGYQPNNQGQYGYQPNNQGQYGYQPNNQGQYGYQPNNQMRYVDQSYPQMQYVDQSNSQPSNQPFSQPFNQPGSQPPNDAPGNYGGAKKKKTGLIISLIVIFAVLLIGAGVTASYFYMTAKKNKEAASTTASEFIKAFGNQDMDGLQGYFPKRLKKEDDIVDFTDKDRYDGVKYYGYTIKDVKVTDVQKYSAETAGDNVSEAYNKKLDVKSSYQVSVKYTETYEKDGATVDNTMTDNIICGEIDEQWYVLDPAFISRKNQIVADLDNEADDDQSRDVAEKLMTCFTESDMEGVEECLAAVIRDSESTKKSEQALTESKDKMNEFGITYSFGEFSISEPEEYDVEEAKDSVKEDYNIEPAFDKCRKFTANYSVTIEVDGESTSKDVTEELICGKEDGLWYIYNSDIVSDHNAIFADIIDEKETARDEKEVRETIEAFVESLALLDIETTKSYMPDEVLKIEDIASSISKLESQKAQLDSYGVVLSLDSIEIGTITEENPATLMIEAMLGYENAVFYIEKGYSTTVTFSRTASVNGRTQSDEFTSDMVCAKIDGKWYILQASMPDEE